MSGNVFLRALSSSSGITRGNFALALGQPFTSTLEQSLPYTLIIISFSVTFPAASIFLSVTLASFVLPKGIEKETTSGIRFANVSYEQSLFSILHEAIIEFASSGPTLTIIYCLFYIKVFNYLWGKGKYNTYLLSPLTTFAETTEANVV